jgi:hypothetical protein
MTILRDRPPQTVVAAANQLRALDEGLGSRGHQPDEVPVGRKLPPAWACALHHMPSPAPARVVSPVSISELVATGGSGRSPPGRTGLDPDQSLVVRTILGTCPVLQFWVGEVREHPAGCEGAHQRPDRTTHRCAASCSRVAASKRDEDLVVHDGFADWWDAHAIALVGPGNRVAADHLVPRSRASQIHLLVAGSHQRASSRCAACRRTPETPFSSTGPISVKVTSTPADASTTSWLTRTSPGRAYSAIREARFTVCP